jgi:hypothetical protein
MKRSFTVVKIYIRVEINARLLLPTMLGWPAKKPVAFRIFVAAAAKAARAKTNFLTDLRPPQTKIDIKR